MWLYDLLVIVDMNEAARWDGEKLVVVLLPPGPPALPLHQEEVHRRLCHSHPARPAYISLSATPRGGSSYSTDRAAWQ